MKIIKYFFGVLLIFSLLGCNGFRDCDDPTNIDCSNYDPCFGEFEADAEFEILNKSIGNDTVFWFNDPTDDTIYSTSSWFPAYFKSKHPLDSMKWKIGLDPTIYTDSLFAVDFPTDAGLIDVTQVAYHKSKDGCFEGNDGIDTVRHSVYFKKITSILEHPLCCDYRGVLVDNPTDTFIVKIFDPAVPGGIVLPDVGAYYIKVRSRVFAGDIKKFNHKPKLVGKLQPDRKTLVIDYSYLKNGSRIEKQFVGVKQ